MMKNSYKKICYLLAASGIKEDEIFDFVLYLKKIGASEFANEVELARMNILGPSRNMKQDYLFSEKNESNFRPSDELENKLVKLLILDTGISKNVAAKLLVDKIHEYHPNISLANLGKRSFVDWLRTVQRELAPSELLHFATLIRNTFVHNTNTDWALKSKKD